MSQKIMKLNDEEIAKIYAGGSIDEYWKVNKLATDITNELIDAKLVIDEGVKKTRTRVILNLMLNGFIKGFVKQFKEEFEDKQGGVNNANNTEN